MPRTSDFVLATIGGALSAGLLTALFLRTSIFALGGLSGPGDILIFKSVTAFAAICGALYAKRATASKGALRAVVEVVAATLCLIATLLVLAAVVFISLETF